MFLLKFLSSNGYSLGKYTFASLLFFILVFVRLLWMTKLPQYKQLCSSLFDPYEPTPKCVYTSIYCLLLYVELPHALHATHCGICLPRVVCYHGNNMYMLTHNQRMLSHNMYLVCSQLPYRPDVRA